MQLAEHHFYMIILIFIYLHSFNTLLSQKRCNSLRFLYHCQIAGLGRPLLDLVGLFLATSTTIIQPLMICKQQQKMDPRLLLSEFDYSRVLIGEKESKGATFPFISFSAALAASSVVYSMNAYPLDLLEILSIIIRTAKMKNEKDMNTVFFPGAGHCYNPKFLK